MLLWYIGAWLIVLLFEGAALLAGDAIVLDKKGLLPCVEEVETAPMFTLLRLVGDGYPEGLAGLGLL